MVEKENITTLNRSDVVLNDNDIFLFMLGLDFVPKLNWSETTENSEWQSDYQHI